MKTKKTKTQPTLNAVEQFFYDQAGYSYDPATETQEDGRRRGATLLASAERWSHETGYCYTWEIDTNSDSSDWIDDDDDGGKHSEPWQVWYCLMRDEHGKVVQSLSSIDFGRDGTPWSSPYRRVVEAELALQEWDGVVKS